MKKNIWKSLATIAVVAGAVYGEVQGVRYLFVGAVIICLCIWDS